MGQPRDERGRFAKRGSWVAAGAVIAMGASGIGGGVGGSAAGSGTAQVSAVRVNHSKQAASRGRADTAWRQLNLRRTRKPDVGSAVSCVVNSYGRVQDFFLRNPCRSLERNLFTLADSSDNVFVVSVSWVRMRGRGDVGRLKELIDVDGTGSVSALGFDLLRSQGVRFTGTPFRSHPKGAVLVVAEGAVVSGRPDADLFETVVEVAALLPGPGR